MNPIHIYTPVGNAISQLCVNIIPFFFGEDYTKCLPLVALQYHDVEVEVTIRDWDSCYHVLRQITDADGKDGYIHMQEFNKMKQQNLEGVRLDCNYIYLDSEDRKRIAVYLTLCFRFIVFF